MEHGFIKINETLYNINTITHVETKGMDIMIYFNQNSETHKETFTSETEVKENFKLLYTKLNTFSFPKPNEPNKPMSDEERNQRQSLLDDQRGY